MPAREGERAQMPKVRWGRFLVGGLIATVVCFVSDGLLHNFVVPDDWAALFQRLGVKPGTEHEHGSALVSFLDYELGRGFGAIFLYVMMLSRYGRGVRTALAAAVITWLLLSISAPAQFIPLGFYSHALWLKIGAFQLVTTVLATLGGAAVYKEEPVHG